METAITRRDLEIQALQDLKTEQETTRRQEQEATLNQAQDLTTLVQEQQVTEADQTTQVHLGAVAMVLEQEQVDQVAVQVPAEADNKKPFPIF